MFCEVLSHEASRSPVGRCDDYLWHLPDEQTAEPLTDSKFVLSSRLRILIVGGAFGDCYAPESTPFADAVTELKSRGLYIQYVPVSGRSSAALNAKIIAEKIATVPWDVTHPLVLVGYSKGTVDILESLVQYSEVASRVSAVVSIAGAVNGSPIADHFLWLYDELLSSRAVGQCGPGDGGVLTSLTPFERLSWLANHTIPLNIRYYSVGTFTTPHRLARVLASSQRELSKTDARNDGQLLARDELIPGSELLAYANADHWSIALRMEDRFPYLSHRDVGKHPFPQQALLETLLFFVQRDLGLSSSSQ